MASITQTNAFGIVTVMDVKVYGLDQQVSIDNSSMTLEKAYEDHVDRDALNTALKNLPESSALCKIDHMQVATLSTDGPNITIQGGKFNNNLIKYGKTARCEMTDALGQMDALVSLGGAEYLDPDHKEKGIAVTDKFGTPVCIVGDSFVVDQKTGKHVPVTVILYQFLPDSTPSFAFDSGNAATFDLNGDLLAVEFASAAGAGECEGSNGTFFAMVFDSCELSNFKQVPVNATADFAQAPKTLLRRYDKTEDEIDMNAFEMAKSVSGNIELQLKGVNGDVLHTWPSATVDNYGTTRDGKNYMIFTKDLAANIARIDATVVSE